MVNSIDITTKKHQNISFTLESSSAVLAQLFAGDTVHGLDQDGNEIFIPYSSVGYAIIEPGEGPLPPTDSLCAQSDESGEDDGGGK